MNKISYWVYILLCSNNTYYTGYTNDLTRRYQEHLQGTAKCKYTRSFKPLNIAQCWEVFESKSIAMRIEKFIKKLSRAQKEEFIINPDKLMSLFSCAVYDTSLLKPG